MQTVKVKSMMSYGGHSSRANGSVDLTLVAKYSELTNSMQLLQMLNNDVNIQVKKGSDKPFKLGMFRIKSVNFNGDGESKIKLNSLNDFVDMDNMNELITQDEFTVLFSAKIEEEEEDDEE